MRNIHKNIPVLFEPDGFLVTERSFSAETNKNNESIFNTANGYIGVRGFFEEGFYGEEKDSDPSVMINGVYEYYDYHHIWCRPGFPPRYHAITNQANPLDVKIFADGEQIGLGGSTEQYERTLNMRDGVVARTFVYVTKSGKRIRVQFTRFASQTEKHLLVTSASVSADEDTEFEFVSTLSQQYRGGGGAKSEIGGGGGDIYDFLGARSEGDVKYVRYITRRSKFDVVCAVKEEIAGAEKSEEIFSDRIVTRYRVRAREARLDRFAAYATMRDFPDHVLSACNIVRAAAASGYSEEYRKNAAAWDAFWEDADVGIEGDDLILQGIRYGIFNIWQSVGKDGITNISANGLTGTAYSGHYFWDTEIFMEPMLLYTHPAVVKKLIEYRYNILDKARERAREMEHPGALYAWNSTNGEECGHVFEAVTAQYHINADIGYSIYKYFEATGDEDFLFDTCAEIMLETSMCLSHRGEFIERKGGKFCINVICGPDEYNPIVDNNLFTNMMVRRHFRFTLDIMERMKNKRPGQYEALVKKCKFNEEEFARIRRAADNMYLAYDAEHEVYMQDDNIMSKEPLDIESIPPEKLPLLVTMHPLNLWRFRVCKQADIVLLTVLLHEEFTPAMRKKIFDIYEPITIHDSSLSSNTFSIAACDIGYYAEAYGYMRQAARMDLDNVNKNTYFGLHAACMGSCWMMLVNGYAGLRIYNGRMHFKPYCDKRWTGYTFRLKFKDSSLEVHVTPRETSYRILKGENVHIFHDGKTAAVTAEGIVLPNATFGA